MHIFEVQDHYYVDIEVIRWYEGHLVRWCGAGMRLPPGEYHIKPPDNCEYHHLHMACKEDGDDRTSPFVMDLSNTFLWLTVPPPHTFLPLTSAVSCIFHRQKQSQALCACHVLALT